MVKTIRIYIQDIGMEIGIERCAMLIIKKDKKASIEGMALSTQRIIRTLGEKNDNYLGILEADTIKETKMKKERKKRVPQKNEKTS